MRLIDCAVCGKLFEPRSPFGRYCHDPCDPARTPEARERARIKMRHRRRRAEPCGVAGCPEPARGERYCRAHAKRNARLGSPTARRCRICKSVVDDERDETGRLKQGHWVCMSCLTEGRVGLKRGERERFPCERKNRTYKLEIRDGSEAGRLAIFVTLGIYPDERVGEIFVDLAKEGSPLRAAFNCWATATSKALQYGMPLREAIRTFRGIGCEPSGQIVTVDPPVKGLHGEHATSVWDAIMRLVEVVTDEGGRHRGVGGVPREESSPVIVERPEPRPLERWRHWKGGAYEIVCVADVEADGGLTRQVSYRSLEDGKVWCRPLADFMAVLLGEQGSGVRTLRFERIDDESDAT